MEVHSLEEMLTRARNDLKEAERTSQKVEKRMSIVHIGYEQKCSEVIEIATRERQLHAMMFNIENELEQWKRNAQWISNEPKPASTVEISCESPFPHVVKCEDTKSEHPDTKATKSNSTHSLPSTQVNIGAKSQVTKWVQRTPRETQHVPQESKCNQSIPRDSIDTQVPKYTQPPPQDPKCTQADSSNKLHEPNNPNTTDQLDPPNQVELTPKSNQPQTPDKPENENEPIKPDKPEELDQLSKSDNQIKEDKPNHSADKVGSPKQDSLAMLKTCLMKPARLKAKRKKNNSL